MNSPTTPGRLRTEPRLADPDAFYEALIEMHRVLTEATSALVNAKLILLLAHHIGDLVHGIGECFDGARYLF